MFSNNYLSTKTGVSMIMEMHESMTLGPKFTDSIKTIPNTKVCIIKNESVWLFFSFCILWKRIQTLKREKVLTLKNISSNWEKSFHKHVFIKGQKGFTSVMWSKLNITPSIIQNGKELSLDWCSWAYWLNAFRIDEVNL